MGASFRNIGEIKELAGCDLLTIAPKLLAELDSTQGDLPRKLDPSHAEKLDIKKISIDKATFEKMHAEARMAHDKLKEGNESSSPSASARSASPSTHNQPTFLIKKGGHQAAFFV